MNPEPLPQKESTRRRRGPIQRIGKFQIYRRVGKGGMASVYEAHDTLAGRDVALKIYILPPESNKAQRDHEEQWFLREARLLARLRHPNIVTLYEAHQEGDRRLLAMKLINGRPLSQVWNDGDIELKEAVKILHDTSLAIAYAHGQNIIHRDLTPENILVDTNKIPYVTDFGLAKGISPNTRGTLTQRGETVGTPEYMSPEQARAVRDLDGRTDIYSLGAILYELLAGRPPFTGKTPMQTLLRIVTAPLDPPSVHARSMGLVDVPPDLEKICLRAVAREREERYPTASKFAAALAQWLVGKPV